MSTNEGNKALSSSKVERLEEYYHRLQEAPTSKSAEGALQLVRDTLDQVEDDLSGIPRQNPPPAPGMSDGRLYPPRDDYTKRNSDGSITAKSSGHTIEIGKDGSISIYNRRTKKVDFQKPGIGGRPE